MTGVDVDEDGIDAAVDPDDWNANVTGVDVDEDGVDKAIDPDDNNASVTGVDVDEDGIDAAVDPDDYNANVTGVDVDEDGVDAAIDPDDNNANVTGVDNDGDRIDAAVDSDDWNANVSGVDSDGDGVDAAVDPDDEDADLQTKAAPVGLTFTELSDTPLNSIGQSVNGVNFGFQVNGVDDLGATYSGTPPIAALNMTYAQGSRILGSSDGILTLIFDTPTPVVSFGSELNTTTSFVSLAYTVKLYDIADTLMRTVNVSATSLVHFAEAQFNHVGSLVKKVTVDYNESEGTIFGFDNLYYAQSDKFFDDFESSSIDPWWVNKTNSPYATTSFGSIVGRGGSGDNFAVVHTGKASAANEGILGMDLNFTESAFRKISFDYNFVTTEFGQSSPQDDYFEAHLHLPNGDTQVLLKLSYSDVINGTGFTSVTGLPTDKLDSTNGGQTGWLFYEGTIFIPDGLTTFGFHVYDVGGNTFDSAVLIDNVLDPIVEMGADESPISSTDYLLTFARMLRGEIDPHDADLDADAVASAEHQAFIAKVNEVINDMENISDSELIAVKDEFLDRLWVARDTLAGHEETTEFLQQAGVAHHLLDASIMTDESLGGNLAAIHDSINQAKTFLVAHINDYGETDALANIRTNIDSVLANIENVNNNEFSTATIVAIRAGIKQAFSDTIDHMSADGHDCITGNHLDCEQPL